MKKPIVGITQGDPNGVGLEIILKAFQHELLFEMCVPVLYANPKSFAYTKKVLGLEKPMYVSIRNISEAKEDQLNLIICGDQAIEINFGQQSKSTGAEALTALDSAVADAANGKLDALVTAPLDKSTIPVEGFKGHTAYITSGLGASYSLMMLISDNLKTALLTDHIPIKQISDQLNGEVIGKAIKMLNSSLKDDFGVTKPKIAVLGLNPHAGDSGLLGSEEKEIISPAIEKTYKEGILCFGPFSADGFFGSGAFHGYDAVLAMYHDQGLIPFKYMAFSEGVNYTAGLPIVRTSPDHGTAYEIAGKGIADPGSFMNAVYAAISICKRRKENGELKENPLAFSELRRERFRLEL